MTISAAVVEQVVIEATKASLDRLVAFRALHDELRRARHVCARAQEELDALIRLLDPLEPAAVERLLEATQRRDAARETVDSLWVPDEDEIVLLGDAFPDGLAVEDQRKCIRSVIRRVTVAPGRAEAPPPAASRSTCGATTWARPESRSCRPTSSKRIHVASVAGCGRRLPAWPRRR